MAPQGTPGLEGGAEVGGGGKDQERRQKVAVAEAVMGMAAPPQQAEMPRGPRKTVTAACKEETMKDAG